MSNLKYGLLPLLGSKYTWQEGKMSIWVNTSLDADRYEKNKKQNSTLLEEEAH